MLIRSLQSINNAIISNGNNLPAVKSLKNIMALKISQKTATIPVSFQPIIECNIFQKKVRTR